VFNNSVSFSHLHLYNQKSHGVDGWRVNGLHNTVEHEDEDIYVVGDRIMVDNIELFDVMTAGTSFPLIILIPTPDNLLPPISTLPSSNICNIYPVQMILRGEYLSGFMESMREQLRDMESISHAPAHDYVMDLIKKKSTKVWSQLIDVGEEDEEEELALDVAWEKSPVDRSMYVAHNEIASTRLRDFRPDPVIKSSINLQKNEDFIYL